MCFRRTETATAAIEFALLAPLLVVFLMIIVELGIAGYQALEVQSAAEAGALYASKNGFDAAGISAAVSNATQLSGLSLDPAPRSFCGCPGMDGISETSCGARCPDGTVPGFYAKIQVSFTHSALMTLPGMAAPQTLRGLSIVRLK